MEVSNHIIKTHIYGKNPKDVYVVNFNLGENQESVVIEDVTLDALGSALGSKFIPQSEVKQIIDDLQAIGGVTFTEEEVLQFVKGVVVKAITAYDSAEGEGCVNNFYFTYDGQSYPYWFNAYERTTLTSEATQWAEVHGSYRIDARKYGVSFALSTDRLLAFLGQLKDYAIRCYNKTSDHLLAVNALGTVDEVVAYDYRSGYPDNIEFAIA